MGLGYTPDSLKQAKMTAQTTTPQKIELMAAIAAVSQINGILDGTGVDMYAPSTIRGNRPLKTFIGAPDTTIAQLFYSEAHHMLRNGVTKNLGLKFDKKSFSDKGRDLVDQLDENIAQHKTHVRNMVGVFTGVHGASSLSQCASKDNKYYATFEKLDDCISQTLKTNPNAALQMQHDEIAEEINVVSMKTEKIMMELGDEFSGMKNFYLKGHDKPIPNKGVIAGPKNPASWFFFCGYAASASNSTIKMPLTMRHAMGNVVGYSSGVLPPILRQIEGTPELQCPPVFEVFTKAITDLQSRLTLCGSFDELLDADLHKDGILVAIDMDTKEKYDRVKGRKKEFAANASPVPSFSPGAKCPFGHGAA